MYMEPLFNRLPEIADKETRCIIFPEGKEVPAGEYLLMESYCNDSECDCRRVFINFIYKDEIVATVGYGWENLEFYQKWMGGDDEFAEDAKGPILELGGMQSRYADRLLEFFKTVILRDEKYVQRLKRHYELFKKKLKS